MDSDGQRLDQRRRTGVQPGWQPDQAALRHDDLLGHAAVATDTKDALNARAADLIMAGPAELADAAGNDRFDRDRRAVGEYACHLVTRNAGDLKAAVENG